jgi:hypothetical protein
MTRLLKSFAALLLFAESGIASEADRLADFALPPQTEALMESYCFTCHDEDTQKGEVRLDYLGGLSLDDRLDLLNKMQEQLYIGEMPPRKKKAQPSGDDRTFLADWISGELRKHNASKLEDKLRMPEFGNYVDHEKLFSGDYKDLKAFTPDRRWLISEFIFDAKFNRLLIHNPFKTIDGERHYVIGDNNRRVNLTNPFLLPTNTGVRYYANTTLDGGHLLTLITNAKEAATYMIYLTKRDQRYAPAIAAIMSQEWENESTLVARENFLNYFIEQVLTDIYQDEHEALLPTFVPVTLKSPIATSGEAPKKAPWHAANPGKEEMDLIFRTMLRQRKDGVTDEQRVARCEKEWFHFGHNQRKIQARITFLNGYLAEYLGHEETFE